MVLNDSVEVYNVLNNSVYTLIDDNKPLEEQVNQSTKWEKFERNIIRFMFSRNSYLVRTIITNHSKQLNMKKIENPSLLNNVMKFICDYLNVNITIREITKSES